MRNDLPSSYIGKVGEEHARLAGQVFTESGVASFMVNWVLSSGIKTIYDPCAGLGAFFEAAADFPNIQCTGSEIDGKILEHGKTHMALLGARVAHEDYLSSWGRKHAGIVCNPPYMRFQKFVNRGGVHKHFEKHLGVRLSGYTNIASMFLLKSLSEMADNARLAFIMPLEFLNAGYGEKVKAALLERGRLRTIIRLNCEREVFPDVITSVGILLAESSSPAQRVRFHTIDDLSGLPTVLHTDPVADVSLAELLPGDKWLRHFRPQKVNCQAGLLQPLSHYGRFSRGIATGANEFFILSQSRINELKLRKDEAVPCITRSSQICGSTFGNADFTALSRQDKGVFLLNVGRTASDAAVHYIRSGETCEYHLRFLTKHRNPWYRIESRTPSPILFGVFSRGGYKVIRNRSGALNLTCYHGFQPNLFGAPYLDQLFLYLNSKAGRRILTLSMREYGDKLDKFEPNDLNDALVPTPAFFESIGKDVVDRAMNNVASSGQPPADIERLFHQLLIEEAEADAIKHFTSPSTAFA